MLLLVEDVWDDDFGEKCLTNSLKTMSRFHSRTMHRAPLSSSVSSGGREPPSKVTKNITF